MVTGPQSQMRSTASLSSGAGKPPAQSAFASLCARFAAMSIATKITLVAAVVLLTASLLLAAHFSKAAEGVPLYATAIAPGDMEGITGTLASLGYRYDVRGGKIFVSPAERGTITVKLAGYGYPRRQVGGTDTAGGFPRSAVEEHEASRRKLEGELVEAIRQLDGVADAWVTLAQTERAYFKDDAEPATASVLLKLRGGQKISKLQANGIMSMVAHAVPALLPERVALTDTSGRKYRFSREESDEARVDEKQTSREMALQEKIQEGLDGILGAGRASVLVTVELSKSSIVEESVLHPGVSGGSVKTGIMEKSTRFDRLDGRKKEEPQKQKAEKANAPPAEEGGLQLGLDGLMKKTADLPGGGAAPGSGQSTGINYVEESRSAKFEHDTIHRRKTTAPGDLRRLCIAIAVDNLKPQEEAAILNFVRTGGGIDEDRGDRIAISNLPFRHPLATLPLAGAAPSPTPPLDGSPWAIAIPLAIAMGSFFVFVLRQRKAQSERAQRTMCAPGQATSDIADLVNDKLGLSSSPGATRLNGAEALARAAQEKPAKMVAILRSTWLDGR